MSPTIPRPGAYRFSFFSREEPRTPVAGVLNVLRLSEDHLYWPELDVDVSVDSVKDPDRFPLGARDLAS